MSVIVDILTKYKIPYWTSGKNVSEDTINIKCPFCNDHSNHCGIFKSNMIYSCWRCQAKGHLSKILVTLCGVSWDTAKSECDVQTSTYKKEDKKVDIVEVDLPEYFELIEESTDILLLNNWMCRRKITKQTLMDNCCGVCQVGEFAHRLIIPIFFNNMLVSYQGADLTGFADLKYKTAKSEINNYLYGYDDITDTMVITEGILDKWRTGITAVASFGTHLTDIQRKLILDKKLKKLIFLWDNDAIFKAIKESGYFKPFIDEVRVVKLPYGEDPDSYGIKNNISNLINKVELF